MSETILEQAEPMSPTKRTVKMVGLGALFLFLLVFFTFIKLPQTKITSLIAGYVQAGLDPYGIYLSDHGRELSIFRGLQYHLTQPTLELSDQTRIELDDLRAGPSFLSLLKGQVGGVIEIKQGAAMVNLKGSGRGDKIDTSFDLDQVDIGKFGLLSFAGGLKGTGLVSGSGHVDGALSDPKSLNGNISLNLKKVHLDEQNLMGFQLPAMNISEGNIEISIEGGKLLMKNIKLGKSTDDIQINMTGDITLNRNLNSSALNLRAVLGFSDKVKQSFTIIDSLMSSARTADGKYAYKLTGQIGAPFPTPDVNGSAPAIPATNKK